MIPPLVKGRSLRFPDQEITWAGECPWTGGFCFGTESGELLICRNDGQDELDVLPIKVSEEAVNDVAFWRDYVGVSTRSELTVARRSSSDDDLIKLITTPGGAHGILATPGGHFFAPMGASGLLRVDPERIGSDAVTIDEPNQAVINFYKLIYLGDSSQDEVLACAARTSGLLLIRSERDKPLEIKGVVSKNVDFIDVCSVVLSKVAPCGRRIEPGSIADLRPRPPSRGDAPNSPAGRIARDSLLDPQCGWTPLRPDEQGASRIP